MILEARIGSGLYCLTHNRVSNTGTLPDIGISVVPASAPDTP